MPIPRRHPTATPSTNLEHVGLPPTTHLHSVSTTQRHLPSATDLTSTLCLHHPEGSNCQATAPIAHIRLPTDTRHQLSQRTATTSIYIGRQQTFTILATSTTTSAPSPPSPAPPSNTDDFPGAAGLHSHQNNSDRASSAPTTGNTYR